MKEFEQRISRLEQKNEDSGPWVVTRRTYSPDEPARQKIYRQLYWRTKHSLERYEDILNHVITRIEKLEQRVKRLENQNVNNSDS
jgi:BMFP domain-containing protein YqiC